MKILVTGGAGYIGSHTVRKLKEAGYETLIFDNLSDGHKKLIKGFDLVVADLNDKKALDEIFSKHKFDAVIHFAGSIEAGESMINPKKFFENNLICGFNLLEAMLNYNVKKIVFSSSAAVYGNPQKKLIQENHSKNPINVYGLTKLMFENILESYDRAYDLKSVSLRYFNAAGADISADIGESHQKETHLIPLVLETALGKREPIKIFGTDYPTPDGTCLRDYVHVSDLANAHILALEYLFKTNKSDSFNLGSGKTTSILKIINTAKKITGQNFSVVIAERREGDPAILCASSKKAQKVLGWKPKLSSIEKIIETAWNWHKKI